MPGSTLPDELRKLGYVVTEVGEIERVLPAAVVEKFVTGAGGALEPLTAGSTRPVASTVTHAGIVRVKLLTASSCRDGCPLLGVKRKTSARSEYFAF